ncbi:hypothetical protein D3C78_1732000 [compost metagenome]
MGRVTNHNVSNLTDGFGAVMPCFVHEVGIRGYGVYFYAKVFQCCILILQVFKFSWAHKCEVCWVEANYAPFAFEVLVRYLDEFTVVESHRFKR